MKEEMVCFPVCSRHLSCRCCSKCTRLLGTENNRILRIRYAAKIPVGTSTPEKQSESSFGCVLDGCCSFCSFSADAVLVRMKSLRLRGEIAAKGGAVPLQLEVPLTVAQIWLDARPSAFCGGNGWMCSLCHGCAPDAGMIETRKYSAA